MPIKPHANATTTPEMREFIRESDLPTAVLARLLKVSETTVRKWRKRNFIDDASHKPHNLNTTLSPAQEYVVVELRKRLLLSLDELLLITQQFINAEVSRAGLQRCLKRHGISRLSQLDGEHVFDVDNAVSLRIEDKEEQQALEANISAKSIQNVLGLTADQAINVEVRSLPNFANETKQRRVLLASDPESRWVYVDIYDDSDEIEAAERYMSHVLNKAPYHIRRILAGNYNDFLARFRVLDNASGKAE